MSNINLLQTTSSQRSGISSKARVLLSRVLMILLAVLVLFYGYLKYDRWQTSKDMANVQAKIAAAQAEVVANKDRGEVVTRQGQIQALGTLIKSHMYWSYLLPELARVTLSSAKYTAMNANNDGKLNLTVNLPSYDDLEKYMQIFDLPEYNAQFSNVKILSISKAQVGDTLQTVVRLELTFNPTFLKGKI